jgi:hypothetical protein
MALTGVALSLALLATTSVGETENTALTFSVFPAAVGDNFDTTDSLYGVFRNAEDFLRSWPRAADCDARCARSIVAQIDFAQDMLVVIAPRDRGQETYDVVVTGVMASASTIDISFLELRHGEPRGGMLCGMVLVMPRPSVALLLSQSDLPVRLFRRRADVVCEEPTQVH